MKLKVFRNEWKLLLLIFSIAAFGKGCGCFGSETPALQGLAAPGRKAQFIYTGALPSTPRLQSAITVALKNLSLPSHLAVFTSTVHFKGKITAQTSGAEIPTSVRFSLKHKRAGGQVRSTVSYDVDVQSDGTILQQDFPFSALTIVSANETLEYSFIPLDKDLPASNVNLIFSVTPPGAGARDENRIMQTEASVQHEQFQYSGILNGATKGKTIGSFSLKFIRGPLGAVNGNLHMKGKITETPGIVLPSKLQLRINHIDPAGKPLRTDTFNVKVQPGGTIPVQTFPFTSINTQHVKESLVMSVSAIDRDFPAANVNLTLSFTPLPPQ